MDRLAIPMTDRPEINYIRTTAEYARTILWNSARRAAMPDNKGVDIRALRYALDLQLAKSGIRSVGSTDDVDIVQLLSFLGEVVKIRRDVFSLKSRTINLPYLDGWTLIVGGRPTQSLIEVEPTIQIGGVGRIIRDSISPTISRQTWQSWTGPYPVDPDHYVRELMKSASNLVSPSSQSPQELEAFVVDVSRNQAQWKRLDQVKLSRNAPCLLRTVSRPRTWLWGWGEDSVLKREAPVLLTFPDELVWIRMGLQMIGKVLPHGRFENKRDGSELTVFPSPPTALRKQLLLFGVPIESCFSRFFVPQAWRSVVEDCLRFFHYTVK
ncbi:MAG: hypothetical protein M1415_05475 [Firmicutes bacterium]|nr:hypothetical protein [Bacillota bacterium]